MEAVGIVVSAIECSPLCALIAEIGEGRVLKLGDVTGQIESIGDGMACAVCYPIKAVKRIIAIVGNARTIEHGLALASAVVSERHVGCVGSEVINLLQLVVVEVGVGCALVLLIQGSG